MNCLRYLLVMLILDAKDCSKWHGNLALPDTDSDFL